MKLKPKLSQYGTTIYTVPKTSTHTRMLLHEFELDLLEQIVKYSYLRAVELVDYFVVINEYSLNALMNHWIFNLESVL